jgi:tripartite-type tricarboxylate transporter receptor subunit TctC
MRALRCAVSFFFFAWISAASAPAAADAVADFYQGKTLTLVIGYTPGGGYDTYARVFARHYGKFIPGHPTVVVQNMPGAGSMLTANHIFSRAPADGTALGMFSSQAAIEPLFGNTEAKYDSVKFAWIGSMAQEVVFCGLWQNPGAPTSFDELMNTEVIFGTTAPAGITYQHPAIMKSVLGAKIRLIPGYPGTREITLAMQKGEVNAMCGLFASSIKAQFNDEVASGKLKLVIQMGPKRSDEFGKIPSVYDYAKTAEQRAVLDIHFKQLLLSRPLAGPPAIPADRLKALRDGFEATLKDPEFLAEAQRSGLEIDFASSEEIVDLLKQYAGFSPELFRQAAAAMGR